MRVADSLVKQLAALGLDRVERPPVDLGTYLSQRRPSASAPHGEPPKEDDRHTLDDVREPDAHDGDRSREGLNGLQALAPTPAPMPCRRRTALARS
jgi:hypothetical protein